MAALIVAGLWCQATWAQSAPKSQGAELNADGVWALLDVMDALAKAHPDAIERRKLYSELADSEHATISNAARRRNDADGNLQAAIRILLETETYQIYFRRFTNITAEELKEMLLDLPYRERRAAGGVGSMLFELFGQREAIRKGLDRLLRGVDTQWVSETALRFAPGWEGEVTTIHLIYDSNAGSFAAEGHPFFNVYSGIDLAALAADDAYAASLKEAEGTMAHELQHVLAEPTLYPETDKNVPWQTRWIDQLTRGAVGEGVANLCSPPTGRLKEIYEDPDVLAALADRYNAIVRGLLSGEISEEEAHAWYQDNYFDQAIGLLRTHLSKSYSGSMLDAQVEASMPFRPDFEHAFGWWMVSRIWQRDPRREVVAGLLENPFSVYRLYNETLQENQTELQIAPEIVAEVSKAE